CIEDCAVTVFITVIRRLLSGMANSRARAASISPDTMLSKDVFRSFVSGWLPIFFSNWARAIQYRVSSSLEGPPWDARQALANRTKTLASDIELPGVKSPCLSTENWKSALSGFIITRNLSISFIALSDLSRSKNNKALKD